MSRLMQLSDSLERARSQVEAANTQLAKIQRDLKENRRELRVAQHNLRAGQRTIATRLVALYEGGSQQSTLEVILGASSLDDMITRMDNAKSVSQADARVLAQVKHFRAAVKRSGEVLKNARASQLRIVAQRAAAKRTIESKISQEKQLYASLRGQIAQMVAAQRTRQLQMQRAATARLKAQQQDAKEQAATTVVGASAVTPEADTVVAPPSTYSRAANIAVSQLGVPYVWGGASPSGGFDCSGLVTWAFGQIGVSLPHSTYALWTMGVAVSKDQLQAGDLVFFDGLGHMGIYIGGGQFVHAPHTGDVVKISSMSESWYASTYMGARRIL